MTKIFRTKSGALITIEGILESLDANTGERYLSVRARLADAEPPIGRAAFFALTQEPTTAWACHGDPGIEVNTAWRRCGIGTAMFELAYDVIGSRLQTANDLTDDGAAFAAARAQKTNRNRSRFCLSKATITIDDRSSQIACTREPTHAGPCGSRIHRKTTYGIWAFDESARIVDLSSWESATKDQHIT